MTAPRTAAWILALATPHVALADVLPVGASTAHPTIASAVAAARDGDIVRIPAGVFSESVVVTTDLTFEGAGPGATIWTGAGALLDVDGADVTVRGLTWAPTEGRALIAHDAGLSIERVHVIDGAVAGDGAGLWMASTTATLTEVLFRDLSATGSRGGAVFALRSTLVVAHSAFDRCTAREGGAIFAEDSTVRVEGSALTGNTAVDVLAAGRGGAIRVVEAQGRSSLAVEDTSFVVGFASGRGGFVDATDADVRLDRATLIQGQAGVAGGAVNIERGTLFAADATFYFGSTFAPDGGGGALAVEDATVEVVRGTFTDNDGDVGGAIRAHDSALTVTGSLFRDNEAWLGGAVHHEGGQDLVVHDSRFEDNDATYAGAVAFSGTWASPRFELRRSTFAHNEARLYGGAVDVSGARTLILDASTFQDNVAEGAGAVQIADTGTLVATTNRFCGNRAQRDAGGAVWTTTTPVQTWRATLFVDNAAGAGGGALHVEGGATVTFEHGHVLSSAAPAALDLGAATGTVTSSLLAYNHGVGLVSDAPGRGLVLDYDAFWGNAGGHTTLAVGAGALYADPALQAWPGSDCDGALWPVWTSPLRNAGAPGAADPDGSRADIGAYGGPDAPGEVWADADADGVAVAWDCDDARADVRPGAVETPYDGVDQDCDGVDLCDLDGDGVVASDGACGGTDCDDADPAIRPGAAETPADGVDQDCDGRDPRGPGAGGGPYLAGAGCECDGGGGAGTPWAWVLAALTLWVRTSRGTACRRIDSSRT